MPPDNRSSRQSSDLEEQASSERSPHEPWTSTLDGAREEPVPGEHVLAELRARHLRPALSVLPYEEDGVHHAHAVELDLTVTGGRLGAALVELSNVVLDHYADAEVARGVEATRGEGR